MEEVVKMDYIPVGTEIHRIEAGQAWEQLDKNEKHYAYYFNQASWLASRICYFQRLTYLHLQKICIIISYIYFF